MAGKSDTFENDFLKLLFNNTTASGIGDATGLVGSTTAGSLYLSLHTADPFASSETSDQTTSEISYTPYARVAVARTTGGWSVTNSSGTNRAYLAALAAFAEMASGTGGTVTYFGVGTASSGTGKLLYSGPVSPSINVAVGVTPQLTTSTYIEEQ